MNSVLALQPQILSAAVTSVSRADIRKNPLFVLAGSPDDVSSLYDTLSGLSGQSFPDAENLDNATLKVKTSKDLTSGITCFQLIRSGLASNVGVVALLVFNRQGNIVRY